MRMGEYYGVDRGTRKGQVAVLEIGLFPPSLVQPAIEEDALSSAFDKVHRTGNATGRTPKSKFHNAILTAFAENGSFTPSGPDQYDHYETHGCEIGRLRHRRRVGVVQ